MHGANEKKEERAEKEDKVDDAVGEGEFGDVLHGEAGTHLDELALLATTRGADNCSDSIALSASNGSDASSLSLGIFAGATVPTASAAMNFISPSPGDEIDDTEKAQFGPFLSRVPGQKLVIDGLGCAIRSDNGDIFVKFFDHDDSDECFVLDKNASKLSVLSSRENAMRPNVVSPQPKQTFDLKDKDSNTSGVVKKRLVQFSRFLREFSFNV